MTLPTLLTAMLATALGGDPPPPTWAERLGYPAATRVLLLHADDAGMCHEANEATRAYLEAGHVRSASLMAPCPWFDELAAWAKKKPGLDLGLHLTLTSEWQHYRWGPLAPRDEVSGLVGPRGYLHRSTEEVARSASAEEVAREIRAQVEHARSAGLSPTHLDTHMGALYVRPDFVEAYLALARELDVPAMVVELTPRVIEQFRARGYPLGDETIRLIAEWPFPKLDGLQFVPRGESYEDVRGKTLELIRGLPPGITQINFHPSTDSATLRRITNRWEQRVFEGRLFSDPLVREFLEAEGVQLTDWKEMMRRFRRR